MCVPLCVCMCMMCVYKCVCDAYVRMGVYVCMCMYK